MCPLITITGMSAMRGATVEAPGPRRATMYGWRCRAGMTKGQ